MLTLLSAYARSIARLWDGLTSSSDRIMILGATNRPNDIDAAILRRMPKRYAVSLPNVEQREKILRIMLRDARLDKNFRLGEIVRKSQGMSGSDLKEACRNAAMVPVREFLRSREGRESMSRARSGAAAAAAAVNGSASSDAAGAKANGAANGSTSPASTQSIGGAAKLNTRPLRTDDFFRSDTAETAIPSGQAYNAQAHYARIEADPVD